MAARKAFNAAITSTINVCHGLAISPSCGSELAPLRWTVSIIFVLCLPRPANPSAPFDGLTTHRCFTTPQFDCFSSLCDSVQSDIVVIAPCNYSLASLAALQQMGTGAKRCGFCCTTPTTVLRAILCRTYGCFFCRHLLLQDMKYCSSTATLSPWTKTVSRG